MCHRLSRATFALVCLVVPTTSVSAHPHHYIHVDAAIMIEDGTLKGLRYVWRFDSKYVDGLKQEYDTNRDGVISDEEMQRWLADSKTNLDAFKFFTTLRQGQETLSPTSADGHRFEITAEGLDLHFIARLPKSLSVKAEPLQIDIYDRTFFTEFVLGDGRGITVEATGKSGACTANVALAPGGEQQKAITAFMKMFGRVDAKLAPAKAITVICKD